MLYAFAELRLLLNLWSMATAVQHQQFGAGNRLVVGFARAHRHHSVLSTPDQKCGQSCDTLEQLGETGVEHVWLPGYPRRLRARLLPCFILLGSLFAAIQLGELRRTLNIVNLKAKKILAGRDRLIEENGPLVRCIECVAHATRRDTGGPRDAVEGRAVEAASQAGSADRIWS